MKTTNPCFQLGLLAALLMSSAAHSQTVRNVFVPEEVFAGNSVGKGELRLLLGKGRPFTVESRGTTQANGDFLLEQKMHFEGEPVQSRSWVMRRTSPGRYFATLTGAAGPAEGRTEGSRLTLRYPLTRWGLVMHQTLDLTEDRQAVKNYGSIRFLGIQVGQLQETIQLKH